MKEDCIALTSSAQDAIKKAIPGLSYKIPCTNTIIAPTFRLWADPLDFDAALLIIITVSSPSGICRFEVDDSFKIKGIVTAMIYENKYKGDYENLFVEKLVERYGEQIDNLFNQLCATVLPLNLMHRLAYTIGKLQLSQFEVCRSTHGNWVNSVPFLTRENSLREVFGFRFNHPITYPKGGDYDDTIHYLSHCILSYASKRNAAKDRLSEDETRKLYHLFREYVRSRQLEFLYDSLDHGIINERSVDIASEYHMNPCIVQDTLKTRSSTWYSHLVKNRKKSVDTYIEILQLTTNDKK